MATAEKITLQIGADTTALADALDTIAEALADASHRIRAASVTPQNDSRAVAEELPFTDTPQGRSEQGGCPVHGLPWTIKPAGTRKATGQPYKAFWKCGEQNDDGSYCREFPTDAWVKAHPAR